LAYFHYLRELVGCGVGLGVGCGVGLGVGCGVGLGVGCDVGFGVGCGVGLGVGCGVAVESGVGKSVRNILHIGIRIKRIILLATYVLVLVDSWGLAWEEELEPLWGGGLLWLKKWFG
jgi:hypothetical protein